ncbi:MAG: hypothetical protein V4605_00780 [Pseudomonadota bacterium]
MDDANKKQFWLMINVAMELSNHPPLTKEAIITWWHMLSKYNYDQVEKAVDNWLKASSKPPTPNDILQMCQHKVTIHSRLPSPLSQQANQEYAKEVLDFVAAQPKAKRDYKGWARKIIANPKDHIDIAVRFAHEALAAKT